jgi:thiamine-phosphate diphosphorylase
VSLPFPIICLITSGHGASLRAIRTAASAGIDLVQIREPMLPAAALLTMVRDAIDVTTDTGCRVLVNDRFDVALASAAAGVHLRADSMAATRIRKTAPAHFLVGRSVHDPSEAAAVTREGGCDYLIFGTVFPSRNKPPGHAAAGVQVLRDVCRATTLPVIAVGGISVINTPEVMAAGASGIAAIELFRDEAAISSTIAMLRQQFDT